MVESPAEQAPFSKGDKVRVKGEPGEIFTFDRQTVSESGHVSLHVFDSHKQHRAFRPERVRPAGQKGAIDMAETKATPKRKTPQQCLCGCGSLTGGGRFRPGHDAKLKGALIKQIRDDNAKASERTMARAKLEELGWGKFAEAADHKPKAAKSEVASKAAGTSAAKKELKASKANGTVTPITKGKGKAKAKAPAKAAATK